MSREQLIADQQNDVILFLLFEAAVDGMEVKPCRWVILLAMVC